MKKTSTLSQLLPREKMFARGVETLQDKELVAVLLRTGVKGTSVVELASKVLVKYSLNELAAAQIADLLLIKGLNKAKISSLLAGIELGRRVVQAFPQALPIINTPEDALLQLTSIRTKQREYFTVLYLNARHQLLSRQTISIGTLDTSLIHPREVFIPALNKHAACCILAHNHPSGDSYPSTQDIEVTHRLVRAGEILGIEILDHLILTRHNHSSLKQLGVLT